jgi:large subunit ribosomal protein L25
MEKLKLAVEKRTIEGKQVKKLRREGIIPANIFGKELKSKSVQVPEKDLMKVFRKAGETSLVEVNMKEETYPSLIHNLQVDPISDRPLHVDFHKVNLKEKITANVPLKIVGESTIVKSGEGLILQPINEVEVEALPAELPHEIEINVENLNEVGQSLHIKDLKIDKAKVEIKNDPEEVVVTVQSAEMKEEIVEEAPTPEDVEATSEKGEEPTEESTEGQAEEKGEPGEA